MLYEALSTAEITVKEAEAVLTPVELHTHYSTIHTIYLNNKAQIILPVFKLKHHPL